MKRALVIVPAYNEGRTIAKTLRRLRAALDADDDGAWHWDILVIDDGSSDDTALAVRDLGVAVITLPVNLGIGGAVQTGYRYAVRNDYEAAIQVDGDGQHEPGDVRRIIDVLERDAVEIVIGSRFVERSSYVPSFPRRVGMAFSQLVIYLSTGRRVRDTTSGFRAVDRRGLAFFAENYAKMFAGVVPLVMAFKAGLRHREVPARFSVREHGASSIDVWKAFFYPFQVTVAVLGVVMRREHFRRIGSLERRES